jgi:hypothetical protein
MRFAPLLSIIFSSSSGVPAARALTRIALLAPAPLTEASGWLEPSHSDIELLGSLRSRARHGRKLQVLAVEVSGLAALALDEIVVLELIADWTEEEDPIFLRIVLTLWVAAESAEAA